MVRKFQILFKILNLEKNNLLFGKYIDNKQVIKSKQYNLHKLHRDAEDYFLKIVFVRVVTRLDRGALRARGNRITTILSHCICF